MVIFLSQLTCDVGNPILSVLKAVPITIQPTGMQDKNFIRGRTAWRQRVKEARGITRLLAEELLLIDEIYDKLEQEEISLYVFDQHNDIQYAFEAGEKRDDNSEEHSLQEEKRKTHIEKMDLLRKQITDISSSRLALISSELPLSRSKVT